MNVLKTGIANSFKLDNPPRVRTLPKPIQQLNVINGDEGRFYVTPEGRHYQSVTTFLGSLPKAQYIKDWVERVGEREAEKKKRQGGNRGSRMHDSIEHFLLGEEVSIKNPLDLQLFSKMVPFLKKIDNIIAMETSLYSDELELAGRCDLIATIEGIPFVIDFKTMTEQREISEDYWLQTTAYSIMFEERTGIKIPKLCIAASADDGHFIEAHSERDLWTQKLKNMLEKTRNPVTL